MNLPKCVNCKIELRQDLPDEPDGVYAAVCADCGPYRLGDYVVTELKKGRRLDASIMKEWIAAQYDPVNNPRPLITREVAVWLPNSKDASGGGYDHGNG